MHTRVIIHLNRLCRVLSADRTVWDTDPRSIGPEPDVSRSGGSRLTASPDGDEPSRLLETEVEFDELVLVE